MGKLEVEVDGRENRSLISYHNLSTFPTLQQGTGIGKKDDTK